MNIACLVVVGLSSVALLCPLHGSHLCEPLLDLGDGLAPNLFDFNVKQIVHEVGLLGHRLFLTHQMLALHLERRMTGLLPSFDSARSSSRVLSTSARGRQSLADTDQVIGRISLFGGGLSISLPSCQHLIKTLCLRVLR